MNIINDIPKINGIYFFDFIAHKWTLLDCKNFSTDILLEGVNVIYFSNNLCPACRLFNLVWFPYVNNFNLETKNIYFYFCLCDWFNEICESDCAKRMFIKYEIRASPTVQIIIKHNDNFIKQIVEGNVSDKILDQVIKKSIKLYKDF